MILKHKGTLLALPVPNLVSSQRVAMVLPGVLLDWSWCGPFYRCSVAACVVLEQPRRAFHQPARPSRGNTW